MLTPRQIIRHARAERFGALLEAVLANGRPCPLALRLHLERDADWALAALALGTRRALELTFPISFEASEMLDRLTDTLRERGIGGPVPARLRDAGGARPVSPVALAAAITALVGALREAEGLPQSEALDTQITCLRATLDDAGAALARWQWTGSSSLESHLWGDAEAGADGPYPCDPADLATVLWLVRECAAEVPHADIPALGALAESMGLLHDRVLGPVVRSAI